MYDIPPIFQKGMNTHLPKQMGILRKLLNRYHIPQHTISPAFQYMLELDHMDILNIPREYDMIKLTLYDDDAVVKINNNLLIKIFPAYSISIQDVVLIADHHFVVSNPSFYINFRIDDDIVSNAVTMYYNAFDIRVESIKIPIVCRVRINTTGCMLCGEDALLPVDDDNYRNVCCYTKYRLCLNCAEHDQKNTTLRCYFCAKSLCPLLPIPNILERKCTTPTNQSHI